MTAKFLTYGLEQILEWSARSLGITPLNFFSLFVTFGFQPLLGYVKGRVFAISVQDTDTILESQILSVCTVYVGQYVARIGILPGQSSGYQ